MMTDAISPAILREINGERVPILNIRLYEIDQVDRAVQEILTLLRTHPVVRVATLPQSRVEAKVLDHFRGHTKLRLPGDWEIRRGG